MNSHKENERFNRAALLLENEIAYAHDLSGNMTFLNQAGEQISGYTCEEARRMNITELLAPEISDQFRKEIMRSITAGVGIVYEIEMVAKDGRRVPLELSTEVIVQDDQPVQVQGIAVPSVIRSQAVLSLRSRCLDEDFFFGISS